MKSDIKLCSELRSKFNDCFKTGEPQYRSFHDLLWQIAVNRIFENEKEPILFYVDVTSFYGNELIVAFSSGGYKRTGVYFVDSNFTTCCDVSEDINELFFQIDKKEQMQLISKSMFANS